jgi:glucose/mannose-6-phosphate isomerase
MLSEVDKPMANPSILDRPDAVKEIDKSNMIELCEKTPQFCRNAIELAGKVDLPYGMPQNIIFAGVGGSAIGGELLRDWLRYRAPIPICVCREYTLPAYADEKSLVIAVSYSGETEETLSAFVEAVGRRCMVLTLSSGGHLQDFSEELEIAHMPIPKGFPPRAAIAYLFFPLAIFMERLGVIREKSGEIEEALRVLRQVSEESGMSVNLEENDAKRLAAEIYGTVPILYGSTQYNAVARRIKCQFNENSKVPSKFEVFSELNHNDMMGWEAPRSLCENFSLVFIRDPLEPPEIKERIELTREIVAEKIERISSIRARGHRRLARMLSAMHTGDLASVYLAILRGVDPTPTNTITHLKREMNRRLGKVRGFEEEIRRLRRRKLIKNER